MSPAFQNKLAVSLLGVSVLFLAGCQSKSASAEVGPLPPAEVEVTPVAQQTVDIYSEWVATIDGSVNAQIQPQVTGYVVKQDYQEGAFVRKEQVLFEIDPRPFQALVYGELLNWPEVRWSVRC